MACPIMWIRMIARRLGPCRLGTLVLMASLLFGGCTSKALASGDVAFEELGGDQCFMFSLLVPRRKEGNRTVALPLELVIDSEQDYRKLFDPKIMKKTCVGRDSAKIIPKVDFSQKTALGLWSNGTCADTGFKRIVWRDDARKTIVYSVITVAGSKPACMGPGPESLNLVAIPKIPAGYKVEFESFHE